MRHERLRKNKEFRYVYRRGKSFPSNLLVVYKLKNTNNITEDGTIHNRIGISVSKKVGKSVIRSRVKRLISESVRLTRDEIEKGFDLVFVARSPMADAEFKDVQKTVRYLYKKAGILKDEKNTNRID